ncbi:MAG: DUF1501 domain-containing protein [Saprospiraceae bacterium]|nr:DUF1501 domain-containing protein [Saprospiraceae bacterium]
MLRRNFLKNTALGTVTIPGLVNGFSFGMNRPSPFQKMLSNFLTDTDHVLVLVRMDGGNDGLNTVIPLDQYDKLAVARSKVILPRNSLLNLNGRDDVKLHPSMTGMQALYNEGKLSIIQSVGYPNPNFSHFRSTDIWMTGADYNEVLTTGWMGRYLNYEYPNFPQGFPNADMPDPISIELGASLSLTFQGPGAGMGMSIANADTFYNLVQGIQTPAPNTPAGKQLEYVRLIARQSNDYGTVVTAAYDNGTNSATYPNAGTNNLAEQLKIVARLISGGLKTRVYMVSIGGFDTHDAQVDPSDHTVGEHANLLKNTSDAITAFVRDMEAQGLDNRVLGMTFSEFGRRVISNFSDGTDHGTAAPMFLFGTTVKPGILGDNPVIPTNANEDDNLPMQYDFRSVYNTILKDWFCIPENDLESIMLDEFQLLPLVGNSDCISDTHEINQAAGKNLLDCYPNPFVQYVHIDYESLGGNTLIQIFNQAGQILATPFKGTLAAGKYNLEWNSEDLPAGTYYVRLQNGLTQQVKPILKVRG